MGMRSYLWVAMTLVITWAGSCHSHARLSEPPSRASAWRFGFDTPPDYNDNQGFCGGFSYQYQTQGGKCGICGDPWDKIPRPHEAGGLYATGTIVRTYTKGQVIPVIVDVDANHRGYFEFRICPNNNPSVEASQTCLNQHPLYAAGGSVFQHYIDTALGDHFFNLTLPADLTCTQCVLQWRYVCGNNWGICEDGTGALGCGPQEEFRACSDIAITGTGGSVSTASTPSTTSQVTSPSIPLSTTSASNSATSTTTTSTTTTTTPTTTTTSTTTTPGGSGGCKAVGVWQTVPGMDEWCDNNCNHTPPYCPPSHCTCD